MRFIALLQALLALCFGASAAGAQAGLEGSLTVYAATSLTDAFEAIVDAFEAAYGDVDVLLNFANSSTLAAQLVAGAPADVFASANELQMAKLIEDGRVAAAEVAVFAHNRLILALPVDNPAGIQSVEDLATEPVLLVLAAEGTPIRVYTDAMLASYASEIGAEFFDSVLGNLVSEEGNVRQVVARVALGEADAGIVYQTDVLGDVADRLITVAIDERHNQLASYPIAPLTDAVAPDLAEAFIRFVRSDTAELMLADYGFCWPAILDGGAVFETRPEPTAESAIAGGAPEYECEKATIEGR